MKKTVFSILWVAIACMAISCGGNPDRPDPILSQDQVAKQQNLNNNTTIASPPTTNNSGVDHYTCPNGHPGAAAAGNCSTCGTALVHNQAWHNQTQTTQPATTTTITPPTTTPPATPEPAQNAAGVWHYTCPNGHEGGGGAATPCSVCGTTLVHNSAYHQ